ncbi:alpha/beta fold family hydrolase [Nitzschia inconspicua]|uniref:Alpha/beta fold family hydrolase n=1 Tax=Nitzschia inconspicua TaxID=303405 RepID=A0A9K3KZ25_9STRA|nr:alpha/beta fold family hydrolase [Nitzschia inconspicua]
MSSFAKLALLGAALAAVYQLAPGDPAWMTELKEPPSGSFERVQFIGGDDTTILSGRLFLPPPPPNKEEEEGNAAPPPLIVMANGLGLTQDSNIGPFAQAFNNAGFAVVTFDYATFGYSGGWPRHQVKPERHVADLKALLRYLKRNASDLPIDIERVALWGTSMGGGHILTVAADVATTTDDVLPIKAVVGNVPHVKSALESIFGTLLRDPSTTLRGLVKVTGALVKWTLAQVLTGETTYIPLHGPPGSAAMMQNPGDDGGYGRLILKETRQSGWTNLASVGSVLPTLLYRPFNTVGRIQVPVLLVVAENDFLCPAAAAIDAAANIKNARLFSMPDIGHFDVYDGNELRTALEETVAFLKEHL